MRTIKNSRVQIGLLRKDDRIGLAGARPTVERLHAREKRQRRDGHERERAAARFEDSPDDQRPPPSRQVLHHQERQGAQRDADPEQERNQVGAEKFRLVRECRPRCKSQATRRPRRPAASAGVQDSALFLRLRSFRLARQFCPLRVRHIGDRHLPAELQRPNVGDDGPAIVAAARGSRRDTSRRSRW